MDTISTYYSATTLGLKQKKVSILPLIIKTKSEKNKSKESIQTQNKKRTFFIWLTIIICHGATISG